MGILKSGQESEATYKFTFVWTAAAAAEALAS